MRHRLGLGFTGMLLLLLIGVVVSSRAYEQGVLMPGIAPVNTVRSSTIVLHYGSPIGVCQGEWESWNRAHEVCHYMQAIPNEGIAAGDVLEKVYYDGALFTRVNQDTIWTASADQYYNPARSLTEGLFGVYFNAVVSLIGPADVNGIPTTHYQFWSVDEAYNAMQGGQVVFDIFLSPDNLVVKDQMNIRANGIEAGGLVEIWTYTDFNTDIRIATPPAEQVRGLEAGAVMNPVVVGADIGFRR